MSVIVYQTFEIKQEKFEEAMDNLKDLQTFMKEEYEQNIELLNPIIGNDHTYALLTRFEGLAEMEIQNNKMYADEEYAKLLRSFFLEHTVQGSIDTQIYRPINHKQKK